MLEGIDRVLIESRDEHKMAGVADVARRFEAGLARHLNIEKRQIRAQLAHLIDRLLTIFGLADDAQFGPDFPQSRTQLLAHQALVVGENCRGPGLFR